MTSPTFWMLGAILSAASLGHGLLSDRTWMDNRWVSREATPTRYWLMIGATAVGLLFCLYRLCGLLVG